jgi:hypothetical protein
VSVLLNNNGAPPTTTSLVSSPNPADIHWVVTYTAKVTRQAGGAVKGTVTFTATVRSTYGTIPDGELATFYNGPTMLASVALAGEMAAYTTSSLSAKTHTIKARYAGDVNFSASTGAVMQVVELYSTKTALTSSPNPSTHRQAVTFTATITSTAPNKPTGKVVFKDGTIGIGSATLSSGVATLVRSTLAVGTHSITAQYQGDNSSAKSTSAVLNQVVN